MKVKHTKDWIALAPSIPPDQHTVLEDIVLEYAKQHEGCTPGWTREMSLAYTAGVTRVLQLALELGLPADLQQVAAE